MLSRGPGKIHCQGQDMRSEGLLALVELKNFTILKGRLIMYAVLVDLSFVSIILWIPNNSINPKNTTYSIQLQK